MRGGGREGRKEGREGGREGREGGREEHTLITLPPKGEASRSHLATYACTGFSIC